MAKGKKSKNQAATTDSSGKVATAAADGKNNNKVNSTEFQAFISDLEASPSFNPFSHASAGHGSNTSDWKEDELPSGNGKETEATVSAKPSFAGLFSTNRRLHRPGLSSKILPIAASRSDLMMPPQWDATLLGTPTVRAIPCGVSLIGSSEFYGNCGKSLESEHGRHSTILSLQEIEGHLKAFNNLHFSHISVRAKDADLAFQDAQIQLESDLENATIRDSVRELRKKAVFLAEAERHFYYQKAKLHFLKMGDRNTKFFHDMVKRNATKSSILAITKTDGTTITSAMEIGQEFVSYFTSLLGTEVPTLPVDNAVFN
ncbi:hypothetical protein Sango_1252900 [Sesamum angolense]|uniref:Uncharacterized protein n=1 Tax=Sesamum angolense TaxID=2727404 RepID=A0AAE2BU05_9LAMI|nr:hypothetical protein Sango_1252900 [Sesamum angolense]